MYVVSIFFISSFLKYCKFVVESVFLSTWFIWWLWRILSIYRRATQFPELYDHFPKKIEADNTEQGIISLTSIISSREGRKEGQRQGIYILPGDSFFSIVCIGWGWSRGGDFEFLKHKLLLRELSLGEGCDFRVDHHRVFILELTS